MLKLAVDQLVIVVEALELVDVPCFLPYLQSLQ